MVHQPLPFVMNNWFGYVERDGSFTLNRIKTDQVSISRERWVEFGAMPESLSV